MREGETVPESGAGDDEAGKQHRAALARAMRLLSRREYCAAEMRRKLAERDFPDDVIEAAIVELESLGYLSEARFAESFLRARLARGETPWLAARKARERGVDEAVLNAALESLEASFDVREACRALIARRDPAGLRHEDDRVRNRLARFLRNKGFDAATILRCLNEQAEDDQ